MSERCRPFQRLACSDDPTESDTGLHRSAVHDLLQRFLQHGRQRLPALRRSSEDSLAGRLAQRALFRRVGLQDRGLCRHDFFFGARPSVPPPKRAMRGSNDRPGFLRRAAIFPSEAQGQKRYHRTGRYSFRGRFGSQRLCCWKRDRARSRRLRISGIFHGLLSSFLL